MFCQITLQAIQENDINTLANFFLKKIKKMVKIFFFFLHEMQRNKKKKLKN